MWYVAASVVLMVTKGHVWWQAAVDLGGLKKSTVAVFVSGKSKR